MINVTRLEELRVQLKYPSEDKHAVFFTDGGCRPNPGIGGWGLHGYFYTNDIPKKGHGCKGFTPTAKGYINLPVEEEPVKVSVIGYVDSSGSIFPETTNNRAELMAFIQALQISLDSNCKSAHFILDSEYVLKGIAKIPGWVAANWRNADRSDVSNNDLWRKIETLIKELCQNSCILTTDWTKGHADSIGNNIADGNAKQGIISGEKGVSNTYTHLSEIKDYWNPDVEHHPFLDESNYYFRMHDELHVKSKDGRTIYYTGDHGKKDEWCGKPDASSSFTVSFLAKEDPVLETIRYLQNKEYRSIFSSMVIAKLSHIFNPSVWKNLTNHLGSYVQRKGHKVDLYTYNDIQLTKEMRPPQQSDQAESQLILLEDILQTIVDGNKPDLYPLTDITHLIYEIDTSKKKPVKKTLISMEDESLDVIASYNTSGQLETSLIRLTIGKDIARRNVFSALVDNDAKVYVVTWRESKNAFRYATVIKTEQDISIWAGVYSNLRIVTPT